MFIPAACASEPHNRQQSNPALANEFIDDLNKQRGQPTLAARISYIADRMLRLHRPFPT